MKRVELHARLKAAQKHELVRGKDITTLTAFMDNKALEEHIEHYEQLIENHGKKNGKEAQSGSLPENSDN
ncbi:hypothetical protein [Pseudaminobacter soli (ex Li et al. 2025)]|uniref:Uncharacterized protein n=1 Tax=Pseudaminobacter soli (ex Li et al. 2025) TaxID=1295366 RepID=A0A2P7RXT5_9HYPH|nr:hypothetical protein [Mesorhizobium soli]PSJ55033.1 hypothetical protein C7I85_26875 [Mesorhizobium soli]